jgi:hypothetical protein
LGFEAPVRVYIERWKHDVGQLWFLIDLFLNGYSIATFAKHGIFAGVLVTLALVMISNYQH